MVLNGIFHNIWQICFKIVKTTNQPYDSGYSGNLRIIQPCYPIEGIIFAPDS